MTPRLLSIVPRGYLPWLRGGLELTARSVVEAITGLPADIHLAAGVPTESRTLTARAVRKLRGAYPLRYRIDGHKVHTDLYHPLDLDRLVARLRPDALICHVAGDNPHVRTAIELDLPTVFFVHGSGVRAVFADVGRMRTARFTAESVFIRDLVAAATGLPVALIRPILDPQRYRISGAGDAVLVVNPHPIKGGHRVAQIAAALPHRRFLVVGGWASTRRDEDVLAVERALAALPNVERIEHVEDMREMFRRSRCLLMPCVVEEAFGRAAAEALIAGLPVLASNRGALPETVGAGGVTLSPDAPLHDWLTRLEAMFTDDELYRQLASAALLQAGEASRQPAYVSAALRQLVSELLDTAGVGHAG